jgi:hypothetical protein
MLNADQIVRNVVMVVILPLLPLELNHLQFSHLQVNHQMAVYVAFLASGGRAHHALQHVTAITATTTIAIQQTHGNLDLSHSRSQNQSTIGDHSHHNGSHSQKHAIHGNLDLGHSLSQNHAIHGNQNLVIHGNHSHHNGNNRSNGSQLMKLSCLKLLLK